MVSCRLLMEASVEQRCQLAAVMASDGEPERYEEFLKCLEGEFGSLDPQQRFYVTAELDGAIIGFVRIWNSPHIREWVSDGIVVLPRHQRKGVGSALLKTGLRLAEERGARSVVAHIRDWNVASKVLHERCGFEREISCYRNSYGEERASGGWQYRVSLG